MNLSKLKYHCQEEQFFSSDWTTLSEHLGTEIFSILTDSFGPVWWTQRKGKYCQWGEWLSTLFPDTLVDSACLKLHLIQNIWIQEFIVLARESIFYILSQYFIAS